MEQAGYRENFPASENRAGPVSELPHGVSASAPSYPGERQRGAPSYAPGSRGYYEGGYNAYPYAGDYGGYTPANAAAELISPRRLLKILRQYWFLMVVLMLLGAAASYLMYVQSPPVYEASAIIEMNIRPARVLADVVRVDTGRTEEVFNTRLGRLRGVRFSMQVDERFVGMWDRHAHPTPDGERPRPSSLSYNLMRQSRLIRIQTRTDNPMRAALSVNAAAEAAEQFFQEENQSISDAAVQWLYQQAENQKQSLNRADDILLAFKIEHNLDVELANQEALQSSLSSFSNKLIQLNSEYILVKDVLATLENLDASSGVDSELPLALPNRELIVGLVRELHETKNTRTLLLERYTEQHPQIQQVDFTIQKHVAGIQREIASAQSTFQQEFELLKSKQASVSNELMQVRELFTQRNRELMRVQSRLNNLERERNAAEQMYGNVLNRIEEARLAADEDATMIKIVERASAPTNTTHPKLQLFLPIGLMGGLALGFLLALAAEAVEDRIFSIAELEGGISSRIIGIVPHTPNVLRKELGLLSLNSKSSQAGEAFNAIRVLLDHHRMVRDKVHHLDKNHKPEAHVIMFSSGLPSEGKTVCAVNLAITSARAGQKTLLIDADMRRPKVSHIFEEILQGQFQDPKDCSLMHHLAEKGHANINEIILHGPVANLDVITSHHDAEMNPSDVIGADSFKKLLAWARLKYDRVIIDSPPLGIVSDGLHIASLCDGVVVVCRAGQTRHRTLRQIILQLRGVEVPLLGFILNDYQLNRAYTGEDRLYKNLSSHYPYSKPDPFVDEAKLAHT